MLGTKEGAGTGTYISESYVEFMKKFNMLGFEKNKTSMSNQIEEAKKLNWSGEKFYLESANVAIYFPFIYLPQAVAIGIGKISGMSIYDSYMLARFLTFTTTIILIMFAWSIYRIPAISIAIIALPMSVFQFFAASIDGLIIALTLLIMSLYMSLINKKEREKKWEVFLIYFLIFVVGTCKANMASLIIIPFSLAFINRERKHILYSIATAIPIILWTGLAVVKTHDAGGQHGGLSNGEVLSHYIHHPFEMASVIAKTICDPFFINSYSHQFVGVLGWIDIPIPEWCFRLFSLALISIIAISSYRMKSTKVGLVITPIVLTFICSTLLIFVALLIQFSPLPAIRVIGVQGRYFIMPAIVLSYLFANARFRNEELIILISMFIVSVLMIKELIFTHYF